MASLFNVSKQTAIAKHLMEADSFLMRLRGLMFTPSLPEGRALIITPCSSVHTFFMRYPIDAIFLDNSFTVIRTCPDMKTWRLSPVVKNARHAVELPAGTIKKLRIEEGDRLKKE